MLYKPVAKVIGKGDFQPSTVEKPLDRFFIKLDIYTKGHLHAHFSLRSGNVGGLGKRPVCHGLFSFFLFFTGRHAPSATIQVLFENGRHVAPVSAKYGHRVKFYVCRGSNVGIQPQDCQNFQF